MPRVLHLLLDNSSIFVSIVHGLWRVCLIPHLSRSSFALSIYSFLLLALFHGVLVFNQRTPAFGLLLRGIVHHAKNRPLSWLFWQKKVSRSQVELWYLSFTSVVFNGCRVLECPCSCILPLFEARGYLTRICISQFIHGRQKSRFQSFLQRWSVELARSCLEKRSCYCVIRFACEIDWIKICLVSGTENLVKDIFFSLDVCVSKVDWKYLFDFLLRLEASWSPPCFIRVFLSSPFLFVCSIQLGLRSWDGFDFRRLGRRCVGLWRPSECQQ